MAKAPNRLERQSRDSNEKMVLMRADVGYLLLDKLVWSNVMAEIQTPPQKIQRLQLLWVPVVIASNQVKQCVLHRDSAQKAIKRPLLQLTHLFERHAQYVSSASIFLRKCFLS